MNTKRLWGTFLIAGLGLAAVTHTSDVLAQKGKKKEVVVAPVEPAEAKKPIALALTGIAWGQSHKQVADQIDNLIEEDYRPIYKKTSPGVKMKILDAQLIEDKNLFRRSHLEFGKLPTGWDNTPLRGEFTYLNKEALMELVRGGEKTYFFFIQDKLWKVIEEHKLGAASPLGKTYGEAVGKFATLLGITGRISPADATHASMEVDWKDASTHLRVIQRSDTALALAYEDNATLARLVSLRPNKPVVDDGIDPDVAAAMKGAPPPPPADDKKKPKK